MIDKASLANGLPANPRNRRKEKTRSASQVSRIGHPQTPPGSQARPGTTSQRRVRKRYSHAVFVSICTGEPSSLIATVPPKPSIPRDGKRPVGRPRKYPLQHHTNGSDASTSKSQSVDKDDSDEDADDDDDDDEDDDHDNRSYWLMKAEPESRLEKGVDVKFSIDDLRAATEPEPWNGRVQASSRQDTELTSQQASAIPLVSPLHRGPTRRRRH